MAITISGDGTMQQMASGGITGGATLTAGTAQASTSGTSITFTSIPSWVKRITVMFNGVSTSGTSVPLIQLGSGSPTTTGYLCSASSTGGAAITQANYTTGFGLWGGAVSAATTIQGSAVFTLVSGNTWICSGALGLSNSAANAIISGSIALSGTLDRVVITTVNGTDTFDAGSINVLYE